MEKPIRVVIADDQYVARGFFEMYIKTAANYELAASLATAEQAVNFCRTNPVDLVILDVMMKRGLDGLTCGEAIKRNDPRVRVILATSTAESKWIEQARQAGIESFCSRNTMNAPFWRLWIEPCRENRSIQGAARTRNLAVRQNPN